MSCMLDMIWVRVFGYIGIFGDRRTNYWKHDFKIGSRKRLNQPVREVEVDPTKEWNKEEGEDEEGNIPKAGSHFLVGEVGKTTSSVAMQNDSLPSCVLEHAQQGVKHVVEHLLKNKSFEWRIDVLFDVPLQVQYDVGG